MNTTTATKEIGIEAILTNPRIVFKSDDGHFYAYDFSLDLMIDVKNYVNCGGRELSYYVTRAIIEMVDEAPDWVRESGIFSFFGPGRAAIREAIETTLTAHLSR